jgi:general secretion pathway protein D
VRVRRQRPPNPAAGGTTGAEGVTEFESGVDFRPMSPRARVTFNLEEADLPDLVRLISNMTGKRFILPGKVRAIKATVYAPTKVTAAEAYNAFLSILEVNGLTVVPAGQYLKIMETGGIETQPLGMSDGGPIPAQDRFMTRLQRLENVSAEDVANLLGRFKSADGSVIAYAPTNTVIITDTGTQIRRMMRLIEAIDVERTGEQIWIEPVHYATAADLAARLLEIFPPATAAGAGAAHGARRAAEAASAGRNHSRSR